MDVVKVVHSVRWCFLDIRVFNSRAPTNSSKPVEKTLRRYEEEKKRNYMDRVIQVEKATFTPVVFSTSGAVGDDADRKNCKRFQCPKQKHLC